MIIIFFESVNTSFYRYVISIEKITLVDNGKIVKSDKEIVKVPNNFFSKIILNLQIPENSNIDQLSEHVRDLVFKAIVKHEQHPRFVAIKKNVAIKLDV